MWRWAGSPRAPVASARGKVGGACWADLGRSDNDVASAWGRLEGKISKPIITFVFLPALLKVQGNGVRVPEIGERLATNALRKW